MSAEVEARTALFETTRLEVEAVPVVVRVSVVRPPVMVVVARVEVPATVWVPPTVLLPVTAKVPPTAWLPVVVALPPMVASFETVKAAVDAVPVIARLVPVPLVKIMSSVVRPPHSLFQILLP